MADVVTPSSGGVPSPAVVPPAPAGAATPPVPPAQIRAGTRGTRAVLAVGTAVSVVCFSVAIVLELLGHPDARGSATDLGAVFRSATALEPWGWATLGTFAVILSPAGAIVATAFEHAAIHDRRTALTSVAVLVVLGVSLVVSLLSR